MAINMSYKNAPHNLEGEIGEEVVLRFFQNSKKIEKITDVSKVKKWQKKDIDLIVEKRIDEWTTKDFKIEVKTDIKAGTYGNLFIEKENHYTQDCKYTDDDGNEVIFARKGEIKEGWIKYSECDHFFFYVPKHDRIYICSRETLRKYIKDYFPPVRTCNDYHKDTQGWCVKIKDLIKKNINNVFVFDGKTFEKLDNQKVIESL